MPFESLGTVSYSPSIATIMAVSLAVSTQSTNVTATQPDTDTTARAALCSLAKQQSRGRNAPILLVGPAGELTVRRLRRCVADSKNPANFSSKLDVHVRTIYCCFVRCHVVLRLSKPFIFIRSQSLQTGAYRSRLCRSHHATTVETTYRVIVHRDRQMHAFVQMHVCNYRVHSLTHCCA